MNNIELIEKYPFLKIENNDSAVENLEEMSTKLDWMPNGWRKKFGEKMCQEISEALTNNGVALEEYYILDIKEKFGALRWYDANSGDAYNEVNNIIDKYEAISERTCICCGEPATKISLGWISPYCDSCASGINNGGIRLKNTVPIEEFYNDSHTINASENI